MTADNSRRGMTLAELTFAVAISAIVMTALMSSFLTIHRMLKEAMGLSELSLAAREVREKLLFSASPKSDGMNYSGLLSCGVDSSSNSAISSTGSAVTMEACPMGSTLAGRSTTPEQVEIELKSSTDGTTRYLFNNKTPSADSRARWLWPTGTGILNPSMSDMLSFDTVSAVDSSEFSSAQKAVRLKIDMTLTSGTKNLDGSPMVRRERIVVPIFGVVQPFKITTGEEDYY